MEEKNIQTNTLDEKIVGTIEPLYISIEQAVKETGIGRNKMLRFAKMRGFPAIITPHKIQIDREMLPIWLRQHHGIYKN